MYILGISAFFHDSAACLLKNGEIIAAAQEERFTRKKHDSSFPMYAARFCLQKAQIRSSDIDFVVFYEKPFLKFERILETYLTVAPRGFKNFSKSMPLWIKDKLFQKSRLVEYLGVTFDANIEWGKRLMFSEHHISHAASAFFPSPFQTSAIMTLDGVGEWTTTSMALGNENHIQILKEIHFPHSLGLLYSAFTYFTGFKVNSGEYKVMGLAPYGRPIFADLIKEKLISLSNDGSFHVDISYFNYTTGLTMTNKKFEKLFGAIPRSPEAPITQYEMDLAASIQKVTEEIVIKQAKAVAKETGKKNLCLAGGVALNCVVNGILLREKLFDEIWIQPAAGDAGGALGAALAFWHMDYGAGRSKPRKTDTMQGAFLGPEFSNEEIESELKSLGAKYRIVQDSELIDTLATALSDQKAIGWMQGRMEFGPRALGARSIIADPRSSHMQKLLNLKVKYRESFRPFAPSILAEDLSDWFECDARSPYMLIVAEIKKEKRRSMTIKEKALFGIDKLNVVRSTIPAVTHVDYSARIQTVHKNTNPRYHELITRFKDLTGCPILVNTSFNVRGEPIVCTPKDAFQCFMGTDLDMLVIGNFIMLKSDQNESLGKRYEHSFDLD